MRDDISRIDFRELLELDRYVTFPLDAPISPLIHLLIYRAFITNAFVLQAWRA